MAAERPEHEPAQPARPAAIAIIGMAGRFPGARDIAELWRHLLAGEELISRFPAPSPELASDLRFVGAEGVLDDIESFDAAFFGYSPRDAAIMDPQHRFSLEVAWHAFEDAGYDPQRCPGPVGTFVSTGLSSYLVRNLLPDPDLARALGGFRLLIHNDKDFAASTLAYQLGLTGPAVAVGTACSSSLVAVHLAGQSLQTHECDLAIAGGASIQVPQRQGYLHGEDSIYSPDGHCRPFDADAGGTVGGSGAAMVVLKRLDDAIRDGDRVHAVIVGSAVNNDGGSSVGYTAPSADGQLAVIAEALSVAGVPADSIGYLEAHGTGTLLGDAVEAEAATSAFRLFTDRSRFCALGSVKANVGHLDAAAGVTGLIKATLAVQHGLIPPHPTFHSPNPHVAFAASPFQVNTDALRWCPDGVPRRAGVSSFGIGGTNVHLVLEQPPAVAAAERAPRPWQLLAVSARSPAALNATVTALADRVRDLGVAAVAGAAATLASRRSFPHRRAVVCRDGAAAAAALRDADPPVGTARVFDGTAACAGGRAVGAARQVVFMFPGHGAQHVGMATELYREEPVFRCHLDECAELIACTGTDVRAAILQQDESSLLDLPAVGQPALFAVEYALARTLLDWGLEPAAVIGHSLGEYVAATVAGALPLNSALRLVVGRGHLLQTSVGGRMLVVELAEDEVRAALPSALSLAAVNAPDACVVAGPAAELERFAGSLGRMGATTRWLPGSRAFHSTLVEPMLADFAQLAGDVRHAPVRRGWVSTLTGQWVAPGALLDPEHWVRHMRQTVRFDAGIRLLLDEGPEAVFVEVGPSTSLSAVLRRHPERGPGQPVLACQPHPRRPEPQLAALLGTVASVWASGCDVDLEAVQGGRRAQRVDCPHYPFQRERHWIDPPATRAGWLSLPALLPELQGWLDDLEQEEPIRGIGSYPGLADGLDELCAALALRYVSLGAGDTTAGATHDLTELRRRLRVRPEYERLFGCLLDSLAVGGVLTRQDGAITFQGGPARPGPRAVAAALIRRHPEFTGLIDLVLHCGDHLEEAVSTPGAGLGVLYPGGRGDLLRRTLGEQTVEFSLTGRLVRLVAMVVAKAVAAKATALSGPRRLRILEVGAGGGRLTWEIAEALRGANADFVVTDIGRAFVAYLGEEATRRGVGIDTRILDITRDLAEQGFAGQTFDIVVGLDVVHVTPDVPATLASLRTLLNPSGLLALVETVAQDQWLNLVWGLSEEWWHFRDGLREHSPLLRADQWRQAVEAAGFQTTAVLPGASPATDAVVIVGQAAASVPLTSRSPLTASDLPEKRPNVAEWGYLPGWRRTGPAVLGHTPAGPSLIFTDGLLGDAVIDRLCERGGPVVAVRPGTVSAFDGAGESEGAAESDGAAEFGRVPRWTLATDRPDDYRLLLDRVAALHGPPGLIAHLWNVGAPPAGSRLEHLDEAQRRGLFSLLSLVRALAERTAAQPVRLLAVTSDAQDVLGDDLRAPERSTVHAAVKVIPREYPQFACSSLDVPAAAADSGWLADRVVDELLATPDEPTVAYRGLARWVPSFTAVPLTPPPARPGRPRPGGVHLVCGGLGGIGLSIAVELARLPSAVVLTSRRPFPPRERWADWLADHSADDPVSTIIRRLRDAESAGGEMLVLSADVTSVADMRAVVDRTVEHFGPITGLVHAAGVLDTAGVIQRRSIADTWESVAAKVRGAFVLEEVLGGQELEFAVFCSSIGAILHKLKFGEVGYVAGNEFLNAYACYRAACGDPATVAIAWTDWLEAGMWTQARERLGERYAEPASTSGPHPTDDLLRALTTAEGIDVFRRVLAHRVAPNVVISTQDLDELLARHDAFTHADHVRVLETMRLTTGSRRRPELDSAYLAPRTAAERAAVLIWESLLGVDGIGLHDDFFALGGDSLIALRFVARLREEVGVQRSVADMFERTTIAGLLADPAEGSEPAQPQADEVVL